MEKIFDAIVIGAGHAGIESGLALARKGHRTLLLTLNLEGVGFMACNPAIGGTAKGHLVREIDALGGQMAVTADRTLLQLRMLNSGKGPAVHSLRGQSDKAVYHREMKKVLESQKNLCLTEGEVTELITEGGKVKGVVTSMGIRYYAPAVVIASGVYLDSRIIIGDYSAKSGPAGFPYAKNLTGSLLDTGLEIRRFKTGTPARIDGRTIDYSVMEIQEGDTTIDKFSFLSKGKLLKQTPCYLTYTNERTHEIIRKNLHRAPLYNGGINGVGPRYCPSIEDKVMRFADKERHQLFVEPEGAHTNEKYIQGMSSSLPYDVQIEMYRTVKGLEHCRFMRFAYAIEYDCINPLQLLPTYKVKHIEGLYTAGQINGSSGYEEAAAQGLIAGINAALYLEGKEPYILTRDRAYIGVLTDDLVTKGTNEPYRMMTARAEHRLYLRQDNADLRLTEDGYRLGLASEKRYKNMLSKREEVNKVIAVATARRFTSADSIYRDKGIEAPANGKSMAELLKRTDFCIKDFLPYVAELRDAGERALNTAEVEIKYEGYLKKAETAIKEQKRMEETPLSADIDYLGINGLRLEARQKLQKIKPLTLAQAARISGVSPADVSVLIVWLQREKDRSVGKSAKEIERNFEIPGNGNERA